MATTDQKKQAEKPATAATQAVVVTDSERGLYFTQAEEARKAWKRAETAGYNLLGGGSFILANIPEGFAAVLNVVKIDARLMEDGGETYKVAGGEKLGLAKSALFKLAAIAGVSWLPGESGRVDDTAIESYVHWRAVAEIRDFMTGQIRKVESDKVIDLRPGSALWRLWQRQSEERARKWKKPEQADAIFQRRLEEFMPHICSMAETKSQLRVVRAALGIQSGYTAAVLGKPFVLPVLVPAPETVKDPVARDRLIEARLMHAMGIGRVLYPPARPSSLASPSAPTPAPPLPAERIAPQSDKQPPPAESETVVDADDMEDLGAETAAEPEGGSDGV